MFVRGMESEAPYPGLRSFRRHEVDIFFGRDDHIDEMIAKLAQTHFLCITGPSGCGKSSLARTGLMNGLESGFLPGTGSDWLFVDLRPGNDPLHALFETAAKAIVAESNEMGAAAANAGPADRASEIRHLLRNHVISSSHDLTAAFQTIPGLAGRPILILIDQFEELFRYAQKDARAAMTFVDVLLQTIAAGKNVHVVITIRTDELEKCSRYPNLAVVINNSQFLTPMLDRFQIQEAIEGPITTFGGTIDSDLTIWLLNSVEDEFDKLPLLQHTLKLLYQQKCVELQGETSPAAPADRDRGAQRPRLTIGLRDFLSYFSFEPGMELTNPQSPTILRRSLSKRLDDIYLSLPGRLQAGTERIFCALTSLETGRRDIRRPLRMKELERTTKLSRGEVQKIIAAFSEGDTYLRIVKDAEDEAHDTVDVTHECVLRLWDRLCDQWLSDERSSVNRIKFLAHLAKNYDDEMHRSALFGRLLSENVLRGGTLQHYWQWFTQLQPTASWATRYLSDFIWFDKSSGKPRSAESIFQQIVQFLVVCRRRQQVLRASALAVAVLLIVGAGSQVAMVIERKSLERVNQITSAILTSSTPKDDAQYNGRAGEGTNRLCNDTTPFCANIHAAQAATISIEELRKYGEYALCPADNLYRSVAPISSMASGECAEFPAVTAATAMKPNVDKDYETGYGIAQQIAVNADSQPVARTLFTAIAKQNPYTPAVFRDLGETYLNDPTLPAQQRFSDGGTCLRRALDLSCQNQQEVYDLYFSIYSLDDLFQDFRLTAPRIVGLLSLSKMLLGDGVLPAKPQKHSVDQIQRLWRGAQPAADAARLIRKGHNCSPNLFKVPVPAAAAADADPACAMVKSLYQRAAQAWGEMLTMAKAPDLDKEEQLQIIFGAGIAGLFWGQDSDFRNVAAGSIDVNQLAIWLEKGRQQREQPRYYSALAMLKCLEKDYATAKQYASGIKSADAKYLDIKKEALACDSSTDLATLFNRPTISE